MTDTARLPKLPDIPTTIFTKMSVLARKHGAINLGQGFPEFEPDPKLLDLVGRMVHEGKNQYAHMFGAAELRERIAALAEEFYGRKTDPDTEVNVTAGATQAIFTIVSAMVHPGDEVILFDPAYDCYAPAVQLCGARPVALELEGDEFRIPWERVREQLGERTRMIIFNNPHNPSGSAWTDEDIAELRALTNEHPFLILSDEVYEHIVFDGAEHKSLLRYPEFKERTFAVSSFGKTLHCTGWKLGYVVAAASLMDEFRKVHQYNVFAVNAPMQFAIAEYLKDFKPLHELGAFYQQKRDRFFEATKDSGLRWLPCRGSYFAVADYSELSNERDTDLADRWTTEIGVTTIPMSVFYSGQDKPDLLRFCFAKNEDTLLHAADRINQLR